MIVLRPARARVVSCERVARARHIRPQSEPNPRLRAPPVFWRAGRRGASGRWGVCAAGGRALGWGGRNFRFFNFRVRWPRNSIRGQTIMAKQTAPREAAVSPSSGRFQVVWVWGGPDALVRCPTQCTLADARPSEPTSGTRKHEDRRTNKCWAASALPVPSDHLRDANDIASPPGADDRPGTMPPGTGRRRLWRARAPMRRRSMARGIGVRAPPRSRGTQATD